MTPERWQQVKHLVGLALERESHQRTTLLNEACAGDEALRRAVESYIVAFEEDGAFIEAPAFDVAQALAADAPEACAGRVIGHYQIIREINRGGMGTVYLAARADEQFEQRVAIKLVNRGMMTDFVLSRFRHERQLLANLEHPNIARLLDGGTTEDGVPYLVMEYVEGLSIDEYCDTHQLNTSARLELFRQVCAAVHYAHKNLIVHRDLKPGNILVTAEGTPKLLDFGIAKLLDSQLSPRAIDATSTGLRLMTPEYASPEQVSGAPITTASDTYSLGVILYELLTGHRPYHLKSRLLGEAVRLICEEEPERPSTVINRVETRTSPTGAEVTVTPESVSQTREGLPERLRRRLSGDLDNIILMALRKEPERRYASVERFAEDLRRHLSGLPVRARQDTVGYRTGKFIRRHKAGVAAAVLLLMTLVGGIVATAWQARIARAERAKAERRFNDVRSLANSFLFEFHDAIESLPGSTPARQLLVKRALAYLDPLAREASGDVSLQNELATAYLKVGDVQGNPYGANLGDLPGALESYRKSLAISEPLSTPAVADITAQRNLATGEERIGDVLSMTGDVAGALERQRKSLALRESLTAAEPRNAELPRELATSYNKVGDTLGWMGDFAGALASHRQALAAAEAYAGRADAARSHIKIGDMQVATKDTAGALDSYRQAISIAEALLAVEPANTKVRRYRAMGYDKIGVTLWAAEDLKGAVEHHRKALAVREELLATDRTNAQARRDLAVSYATFADTLLSSGNEAEALSRIAQSVEVFEALAEADPANAGSREDLVLAYNRAGKMFAADGQLRRAADNYRKAQMIAEKLSAEDPSNIEARHALADSYSRLGAANATMAIDQKDAVSARRAHWSEACSWYQRSQQLFREMSEQGVLHGSYAGKPAEIERELTKCETARATLQ